MKSNSKNILHILFVNALLITNIQSCPIYLTISLDSILSEESRIEINWGPNCIDKPEWIGIFQEDPAISTKPAKDCIRNITTLYGKYVTKVNLGKLYFPGGWERDDDQLQLVSYAKGKCLPFYVASFAYNDDLIRVECLKIQPNWMRLSDQNIGKVPLKNLFIPGTHSSGAYNNYNYKNHSILVQTFGCSQNLDIWSQLVFGIRYLDLKIGYREETNDFWIVNENMMITPLQPVLDDVKHFVKVSGEIVIVDFTSFPIGFHKQPERHSMLLKYLLRELKEVAFRRSDSIDAINSYDLTMNDMRKENKNIIITYRLEKLASGERECDLIWPSWKKFSIRNQNLTKALDFMRVLFTQKDELELTKNKGWIFEAITTIEETLNSQKTIKSARNRASELNSNILNFIGGPWSLTANVVTLDFFSSTNLIDIAIYANSHKAFTYANNNLTKFDIKNNNYY
ncbi:uncharacterized protein LOC129606608 [Condylostylus longicornis]|uniref:uncharacterized protein LOC129606608 n=1 Tax=Condylostylus longicornis TaxID=2530218 RepID=UPI00244DFD7F|nr:uncharacterized protein LOC129606608 [Condylostylus longicornis]